MSRMRAAVAVPVAFGVLSLLVLAVKYGVPQHYEVREQLVGISVFWHEDEAFIFIHQDGDAHRYNWLARHAPDNVRSALMRAGVEAWSQLDNSTKAYHLAAGRLEAHVLEQTPMFAEWALEDGHLVARPRFDSPEGTPGFRWSGPGWERVDGMGPLPEDVGTDSGSTVLTADDDEGQMAATDFASIPVRTQQKLEEAGWHFEIVPGYKGIREPAKVPIDLRGETYSLTLSAIRRTEPGADPIRPITLSVSLSGKTLQPSPQVLFAGGDVREVSRGEFERLVANAPGPHGLPQSGGVIADVLGLLVPVVGALLAVWLIWKGPTRGVKIALVVFVIVWAAPSIATAGWMSTLPVLVIPPTIGILTMVASTQLVRYRIRRELVVVGEDACPAYARAKLGELTAALEAMGFRFQGDRQSTWQMMSQNRLTFIRFFSHSGGNVWAEIQATDEPRNVGRLLGGFKGATSILTADLQANQELLRDPQTLAQRVPRAASCAEMLAAHETLAMKIAGMPRTIDDPVAADVEGYNRWVDALVRSEQVNAQGDWFKISLRAAVPLTLRVMGAWFH